MDDDAIKTGAQVGGVAATVGATAATAATAFGLATAIGTAIPVPLIGTAIGAIVGAFTAMGIALAHAFQDTFHPSSIVAASWLLLMHISPGFVYADVDTITSHSGSAKQPANYWANRLVRYLKLVAGIKKNNGPLYNPNNDGYRSRNLPTDTLQKNGYIESQVPDKGDKLTDRRFLAVVERDLNSNRYRIGNVPSLLRTPVEARAALGLLRNPKFAASGVLGWDIFKNPDILPDLRRRVAELRALAGEHGPDPVLAHLLGGDVTPVAVDRRTAGIGDSVRSGVGFGIGLVPGLFIGAALVATGTAVYQHFKRPRKAAS